MAAHVGGMLMDKVRTIRAVYLCIGLALLAIAWPELGLWAWPVVPMFFFPNCVCCGSSQCGISGFACNPWSPPTTITADISGITGAYCPSGLDCIDIDGTYVLGSYADLTSGCRWQLTNNPFCATTPTSYTITVFLGTSGLRVLTRVSTSIGGNIEFLSSVLGTAPIDCTTLGTVNCTYSTHNFCNPTVAISDVTF